MCSLIKPKAGDHSDPKSSLITRFFLPSVTKEVVSMGTGTKCIGQSKMRKSGKPTLGLHIACRGSFGNGVHVALSSPGTRGHIIEMADISVHVDSHWH